MRQQSAQGPAISRHVARRLHKPQRDSKVDQLFDALDTVGLVFYVPSNKAPTFLQRANFLVCMCGYGGEHRWSLRATKHQNSQRERQLYRAQTAPSDFG